MLPSRDNSVTRCSFVLAPLAGIAVAATPVAAQQVPSYVPASPMLQRIQAMPERGWGRVNVNLFHEVWTPAELRPHTYGTSPDKIIAAWSSFAWDSKLGDLLIYGGGHANYSGNDVYRWRSRTLAWERASLPSAVKVVPGTAVFLAVDGPDRAPASAHTYDNSLFLPLANRFMTWGGALFNSGTPYLRPSESDPATLRRTGPYLFDPGRANANQVGGSTGSHVQTSGPRPDIVGGNMWQNRDIYKHLAGQPLPGNHINGCSAYAQEFGRDVAYVAAAPGSTTTQNLYRYELVDVNQPSLDRVSVAGIFWSAPSAQGSCSYDPDKKLFLRTATNSIPFVFWDLNLAGATNRDQRVEVSGSIAEFKSWLSANAVDLRFCGMDFDPVRREHLVWCGKGVVWAVQSPSANVPFGWSARAIPAGTATVPPGDVDTGILGKWKYAPYFDVFIGLMNRRDGDIWIYKPAGWAGPSAGVPANAPPSVSITAPASGAVFAAGNAVTVSAVASDSDGTVARVEFFANGSKIGEDTAAPFAASWVAGQAGSYALTARATDQQGASASAGGITIQVQGGAGTGATVVLQQGRNGYVGASDIALQSYYPNTRYGAWPLLYLHGKAYTTLLRFAIFAADGGPVPNGASIVSARLEVHKEYYNYVYSLHPMLKLWDEASATWNSSRIGVGWAVAGANGAGTDYAVNHDAQYSVSWDPQWMSFDVTARVAQYAAGAANLGWQLRGVSGYDSLRRFKSSQYAADPSLRPRLTITYR
jgi:hypothetical protein